MKKRVILIVIDSVGIGEMPDSASYGDKGSDTLGSIVKAFPNIKLDNMKKLGLFNIDGCTFTDPISQDQLLGNFGKLKMASNGKDTTTGHWEIAGLKIDVPFKTYPNGFPSEIIEEFEKRIGRATLCNKPASGTVILEELGAVHVKTGSPIIYTSADSVFQIAAHEDVVPLDELYGMCRIAREMLMGENLVARVIARPFIGKEGNYERTPNRRDYSIDPYQDTILDILKNNEKDVIAVGKIVDIFNKNGITEDVHTISNMDGLDQTLNYIKTDSEGLIFTNLVDFDAKYGHRRDVKGYMKALEEFDIRLPQIYNAMRDEDILMITADHGNDPSYAGTDHTREFTPILTYGRNLKSGVNLGLRNTFADISETIAEIFGVEGTGNGKSFLSEILK